jgi:uncharacterized coiled-coil protein SlyX
MNATAIITLVGIIVTVLVAVIGGLVTLLVQLTSKRIADLERAAVELPERLTKLEVQAAKLEGLHDLRNDIAAMRGSLERLTMQVATLAGKLSLSDVE